MITVDKSGIYMQRFDDDVFGVNPNAPRDFLTRVWSPLTLRKRRNEFRLEIDALGGCSYVFCSTVPCIGDRCTVRQGGTMRFSSLSHSY